MQVFNSQHRLSKIEACHVWWEGPHSLQQSGAVSTFDVLHHKTEVPLGLKTTNH